MPEWRSGGGGRRAADGAPAQAPDGAAPRAPLEIVRQAPVEVPADLDPKLGRVLVQLEADVAADGAVSDVRLLAVSIVAEKVEMTADPAALREDFDAMVKASIASLRQWRFDPPASAPAVVRVPIYFDVVGRRTSFGSIRPMSGYPPHVTAVPPSDALKVGGAIKTPKKLVNVPPRYPDDALQAKVQGEVVLDVVARRERRADRRAGLAERAHARRGRHRGGPPVALRADADERRGRCRS